MAGRIWKRAAVELGLGPRASWGEIQAAYRRLALALHPDVNRAAGVTERFRRVNEAYRRLGDMMRERTALSRVLEDSRARELPVEELAMRLAYSGSAEVRRGAAFLLGRLRLDSGDLRPARAALVAALEDREESVRAAVLEALGRIGGPAELARAALRAGAVLVWARSAAAWILRALSAAGRSLGGSRMPRRGEGRHGGR